MNSMDRKTFRYVVTLSCTPMLLVLSACTSAPELASLQATAPAAELLTLDSQDSSLVSAFNEHSQAAQLVVVLSPT